MARRTLIPDLHFGGAADVLRSYVPGQVVIEASTPSEWVPRHLESLRLEVVVAAPKFPLVYATRHKKQIKTDPAQRQSANDLSRNRLAPIH